MYGFVVMEGNWILCGALGAQDRELMEDLETVDDMPCWYYECASWTAQVPQTSWRRIGKLSPVTV